MKQASKNKEISIPLYAFDGTWNDSRSSTRDRSKDTNLYLLSLRYDKEQGSHYLEGVGTEGSIIRKGFDAVVGRGSAKRVRQHFETLKQNFRLGKTTIDVIGYSRGAAIARMFVHKIANEYFKIETANGVPLSEPPSIRFLGLFDTVASLGLPWTDNEHAFDPLIPDFVQKTYHAMALDEVRETFGIERCIGRAENICEVWFRGSHADIGGNTSFPTVHGGSSANRDRSNITLNWMLAKAKANGLPILATAQRPTDIDALVTSKLESIAIGKVGTLSRRIHIGDLVHYSVDVELGTTGVAGNVLRRIDVPTRIEDRELESQIEIAPWIPIEKSEYARQHRDRDIPHLVTLSSRRYPFDIPPARTWKSWLALWGLDEHGFQHRLEQFWVPTSADQRVAWDIYVELTTRIATRALPKNHGDLSTAPKSIADLFKLERILLRRYGPKGSASGILIHRFLEQEVRKFTTKWHPIAIDGKLAPGQEGEEIASVRQELSVLQPKLRKLAMALSLICGASIEFKDSPLE